MNFTKKSLVTIVTLFSILIPGIAGAASYKETNTVAAGGYDVVAYFTHNDAYRGDTSNAVYYNKTTYLFRNKANKARFEKNPEKYLPQYGGFCAMGVAMKKKFPIDPRVFSIVDSKLYFNMNKSVQRKWNNKRSAYIQEANENWDKIDRKHPTKL